MLGCELFDANSLVHYCFDVLQRDLALQIGEGPVSDSAIAEIE
jgi:hypothetical protein